MEHATNSRSKDGRILVIIYAWSAFFLAPFFWPNIFPAQIGVDLATFTTGLFAAAWMQTLEEEGESARKDLYGWLFLGLCLLPTTVLLIYDETRSPWHAWRQCLYLTGAWLVYAMGRSQASRLLNSQGWAVLLAIFAHLYIIYALLQAFDLRFLVQDGNPLFSIWSQRVGNFPGPLMQQNWQALFLAVTTAFLWRKMAKHHKRRIWEVATILPVCGLFLTASRSGVIVLVLACIGVLLFSSDRKQNAFSMLRALLVGGVLSVLILNLAPDIAGPGIIERVETGGFLPRILIWDINWNLFLSHPWLGIGWGNLPAYGVDGTLIALAEHPELAAAASMLPLAHVWAHNVVLQFLAEGGIFGGVAILMILVALGRQGWKWFVVKQACADDGQINGWLASVLILAHGMVSVSLMQPFFMVLLALSLAACFYPTHKSATQ